MFPHQGTKPTFRKVISIHLNGTATAEQVFEQLGKDLFSVAEGAALEAGNSDQLKTAVSNPKGGTIKLTKDLELTETLKIINKNLILDLNGKTLNVTGVGQDGCSILVNKSKGKLTIKDSGEGVKIVADDINYGVYAKDGGTIIVDGGSIESGYAALTGNNTTGNMNFTVNGGTLTAKKGAAIYSRGKPA